MKSCKTCHKISSDFYASHASCKTCVRKHQLEWYANNKERNYTNSRRSKLACPETIKRQNKASRDTPHGKERARINNANRRALERNAPGKFTAKEIRDMLQKQNGCCNQCSCDS